MKAACEAVRAAVLERAGAGARPRRPRTCGWTARRSSAPSGEVLTGLAEVLGDDAVEETVEWRHRPTHAIDPETGQGDAHVQFAFSAHRAVVDVDVELGLVKVVALDTAQDVGKAINPDAVVGQIHGGSAQGMGLALMEEIVVTDGHVRNPSFTDYLIPTILDMPPMQVRGARVRRPARALRRARGGGAADDLLRARPSPRRSGPRPASRCAGCRSARSTSPAPDSLLTPS